MLPAGDTVLYAGVISFLGRWTLNGWDDGGDDWDKAVMVGWVWVGKWEAMDMLKRSVFSRTGRLLLELSLSIACSLARWQYVFLS